MIADPNDLWCTYTHNLNTCCCICNRAIQAPAGPELQELKLRNKDTHPYEHACKYTSYRCTCGYLPLVKEGKVAVAAVASGEEGVGDERGETGSEGEAPVISEVTAAEVWGEGAGW